MTFLRASDGKARLTLPTGECRICSKAFVRMNSMQIVCGLGCARKIPVVARQEEKAKTRAAKEALKTMPTLRYEAQRAFNEFIRARDAGKPCICCGKFPQSDALTGGEWDAGHYRSRGAAIELAFDERNCHAQLKRCNRRAWDVASYRRNLIERIGLAEVESLEGHHEPKKYTRDDMRAIRDTYRAKAKALNV